MKAEDYELIDHFFAGSLTDEDLRKFDQRMQQKSDFKSTVFLQQSLRKELQRDLRSSPTLAFFQAEAAQMAREDQADPIKISPLRPIRRRLLAIACGVLVIIVSGVTWANLNYRNDIIIRSLHDPLLNSLQADQLSEELQLLEAKEQFYAGDFFAAENTLKRMESGKALLPGETCCFYEVQSLLAYTYFNQKKYPAAVEQFSFLLAKENFSALPISYQNEDKLRWTRLLAMLANGQEGEAIFKEELNFFRVHKSDRYRAKAQALDGKLNAFWRKLTW